MAGLLICLFFLYFVQCPTLWAQNDTQMQIPPMPQGESNSPIHETLTEEIMNFYSDGAQIQFAFMLHAGIYRLSTSNEKFDQVALAAARSYRLRKPVKVTLSGKEILNMEVAE